MSHSERYKNVSSYFCDIKSGLVSWAASILIDKVQRVQNPAARLVSTTCKYDRITPVKSFTGYV